MSVSKNPKLNYLLLFIVLILSILTLSLFRIKTVNCQHENGHSNELDQVCPELNQAFRGQSLLFSQLSGASIWQTLLEREDFHESYYLLKAGRTFPSTITLVLNSKPADYRLKIAANQPQKTESYILNQNNRLKKDLDKLEILTISYQGDLDILEANDSYLDKNYHHLFLKWQQAIAAWEIPAKEIVWQNNEAIKLDLGRSWLVVLDLELDFNQKMQELASILADEEMITLIQGHQFLDLRFNLPVIRDQL